MKFDLEKRAQELFLALQWTAVARDAGTQLARETAAAIADELLRRGFHETSDSVSIARRYATPPLAAAPTPEAIEEAKAALVAVAEALSGKLTGDELRAIARAALAKLEGRS